MTTPRLIAIGDELERAATADLAASRSVRRTHRRRIALGAVTIAIAIPGVAAAAGLFSTQEVAASLPAGTLMLGGTDPTCEVIRHDVEYRCTLAKTPQGGLDDMNGTVEPTVDASRHVNGGCRSLRSDGREWRCYIGRVAVDQQIIGPDLLGQKSEGPGVG